MVPRFGCSKHLRALSAMAFLLLAACSSQGSEEATSADAAVETTTTETRMAAAPPASDQPQAVELRPGQAPQPVVAYAGAPQLAYSYVYSIKAPTTGVTALLRRHEAACQAAGPLVCQVIGSNTEQAGERELSAELSYRATPAYVARFRSGLTREVEGARGTVASSKVETEDLTRSIVDTEARLRAGRLLRTRLEALIASRPGNLQQLLEIERELARVGGEIDAAESNLAVMRARVSMSTVTLDYASEGAVVDPGDSRPLAEAGDSFARNLATSSAAILTFVSLILPWAVILGLGGWALAALARRNRKRASKPPPSTPTDFADPSSRPSGG